MANTDFTATASSEVSPQVQSYVEFTSSVAYEIFITKATLKAARALLEKIVDLESGLGSDVDCVLSGVDYRLQALAEHVDGTCYAYKAINSVQS
tara:strand:+ start:149355 stop:149636 length:282 start_codon:yes stop_codon:yes gene_type:complete